MSHWTVGEFAPDFGRFDSDPGRWSRPIHTGWKRADFRAGRTSNDNIASFQTRATAVPRLHRPDTCQCPLLGDTRTSPRVDLCESCEYQGRGRPMPLLKQEPRSSAPLEIKGRSGLSEFERIDRGWEGKPDIVGFKKGK